MGMYVAERRGQHELKLCAAVAELLHVKEPWEVDFVHGGRSTLTVIQVHKRRLTFRFPGIVIHIVVIYLESAPPAPLLI